MIRVKYAPGQSPPRCRAVSITVILDVNDAAAAGISNQWRLDGSATVEREVELPEYFRGRPDVASAVTISQRGRISPPATVLITGAS